MSWSLLLFFPLMNPKIAILWELRGSFLGKIIEKLSRGEEIEN